MTDSDTAGGSVGGRAATVVVGLRVKAGHRDAFEQWQDGLSAAAAEFPGFLGTQVEPSKETPDDWTVVYRFDSAPHLYEWLNSSTRHQLLARGDAFLDGPASQHVMVDSNDEGSVTVVVSHPVRQKYEREFIEWQDRVVEAEGRFPGFRGAEVFRPVPGVQDDWTAVYRYASQEDLDRWLESDERKALLRQAEHFQDYRMRKVDSLFGSWFSIPGGAPAAALPNWKLALSVLVALYPTVVFLTLFISWVWDTELWKSLLLGNILSVGLLTWLVTPLVSRALRFWLSPSPDAKQPRTDVLGLVVCVAFLAVAATAFWLMTNVVWLLP